MTAHFNYKAAPLCSYLETLAGGNVDVGVEIGPGVVKGGAAVLVLGVDLGAVVVCQRNHCRPGGALRGFGGRR